MKEGIPKKTVYRLSLYSRCLERLGGEANETVSSEVLARVAGVKPTQLRKDLACCGHFGKRGLGYDVEQLRQHLAHTLGTATLQPVILVGAGSLGSALLRYTGFAREGFEIVAAFDERPNHRIEGSDIAIYSMSELSTFIRTKKIKMAILCVPAPDAQDAANQLIAAGIQAVLNFAPLVLQVPEEVAVNNVNLAIELESLGYFIQ
ncbi:MAG: redox-sensing transcriptional repressor Rex [Chthoniobacterales bacterium]